jgi:ACR3 family arsenite efflux pump ArsB
MNVSLSKNDQQLIKLSSLFKFVGLFVILLGFIGVLIGVHKLYIINTIESRYYDTILTFISVGIICFGYLIYIGYRTIEKLKNIHAYTSPNERKI